MTDTITPAPTVSSNRQAAQRACDRERERVLKILATVPQGAVPAPILQAIADGAPAPVFASAQRLRTATAAGREGAAVTQHVARSGKWGPITSRLNAERRVANETADTEGSAT